MSTSPALEKRAFFWVLFVLAIIGLWMIFPFLNTVLLSIILAVLFYPFHRRYLNWMNGRKGLAATASVFTVLLLLVIPTAILITLITSQIATLVQHFAATFSAQNVSVILNHWESHVGPWLHELETFIGTKLDIVNLALDWFQTIGQYLAQFSPAVVSSTANFFFHFFIMLILLFYLFRDGDVLFEKVLKLSPIKDEYERKLASEIQSTIYGVFYGSFLTGAVQATLATIGYAIAGIPGVFVWGFITFFMSFIPIVGTAGTIIPLIVYLLVLGKYSYAVFLTIYGVVVIGSADNLLRPILIRTPIHQAFLFLSLFGGIVVFGPLGILLGPIIMALFMGTLKIYEDEYLDGREMLSESVEP